MESSRNLLLLLCPSPISSIGGCRLIPRSVPQGSTGDTACLHCPGMSFSRSSTS